MSLEQRVSRAWMALNRHPTMMTRTPHPNPDMRRQGRSFRSYVVYLLRSAGNAGQTRACKYIEEAARRLEQPQLPIQEDAHVG